LVDEDRDGGKNAREELARTITMDNLDSFEVLVFLSDLSVGLALIGNLGWH